MLCAGPITNIITLFPVVSMFFFFGLVFGSVPMLIKKAEIHRVDWKLVLSFVIGLAIVVSMAYLPPMGGEGETTLTMNFSTFMLQIVTGVVVAIGFILPGISTSYLLLVLGTYDYIMLAISNLDILALVPFVLGFVLGVILLTRVLEICMQRFPQLTYSMIMGFLLGLTYSMIMGFLLGSVYTVYPGHPEGWEIPLSILFFALGFVIIYFVSKREADLETD